MKSARTKVLHPVAGRPMIEHVLRALGALSPERTVVVVGRNGGEIERALAGRDLTLARQEEPLGTAHALLSAAEALDGFEGDILVMCGDTPLVRPGTLERLAGRHRTGGADATLLTCRFDDPAGYGRVVRNEGGGIDAIVEEREAGPEERSIREVNTGIYCFRAPAVFSHVEALCREETDHEFYLTDIVARYGRSGLRVEGLAIDDADEVMGINTRRQLSEAEAAMRERIRSRWLDAGVTLIDPPSIFIDDTVTIGTDTTIHPFVIIEGKTRIGGGAVVGPYSRIIDSVIGEGCRLAGWNRLLGVSVPAFRAVGPFADTAGD
jgi:bifunctional UDP-N-acetylglucosamine pyrophosphorylase/glucosamine-1-phosphate N-acetyltransferase